MFRANSVLVVLLCASTCAVPGVRALRAQTQGDRNAPAVERHIVLFSNDTAAKVGKAELEKTFDLVWRYFNDTYDHKALSARVRQRAQAQGAGGAGARGLCLAADR